ncbi:hypothetical protein BJ085DRAFT_31568 [Dimargaris cristalligena]|uniref:Uncharacterized protein n=1 Tax=Dimargaris cristalligena TaxID=215637 RepID=A0A4P9ZYE8_9FUNG|nr:hypothetical protein BJ085DRAFT_31568 [Dimargaris cristalligena]|eukprot:RKP38398.1 hypothetical protein BJ085DRAFT_31568 [Dimargaris cristalligena]
MSIPVFIAYGVITIVAVVVGVSLVRQAYIRRTRPVPVSCWYPIVPPSTKPAYTCGVVHTSEKVLCNAIGIHVAHLWVCVLCQAVPVALLVMEYPWFNTSCSVKVITTIGPALQGLVSAILFLMNPTLYRYWDIRQEQLSSHHYDDVALGDFPPISSDPYHVAIPAPSNPFLAGPPPPSAEFKEDTSRSDLRRASWFSAAYTRNSNTNEPVRPSFTQWSFPTPHPTSTGVTSLPHSLARGAHLVGEPGLGAVVLFTTPISCPPIPAEDPQRPTIQH